MKSDARDLVGCGCGWCFAAFVEVQISEQEHDGASVAESR